MDDRLTNVTLDAALRCEGSPSARCFACPLEQVGACLTLKGMPDEQRRHAVSRIKITRELLDSIMNCYTIAPEQGGHDES